MVYICANSLSSSISLSDGDSSGKAINLDEARPFPTPYIATDSYAYMSVGGKISPPCSLLVIIK